jgi:hypothetical protein
MARYFLHLRGVEDILDDEGTDFIDIEAVRRAVVAGARDVIASHFRATGVLDLRYRIDAEKEDGQIAYTLAFKEAVHIVEN